nr:SMI1/KNR4 family protein [uncultured Fluviicola sp.]
MNQLLKEISSKAIELGDYNFALSKEQIDSLWIGYEPTTKSEIEKVEKRLGISLPQDYVDFLLITNGFHAATGVEPSFCKTNDIDYLKNVDSELYEIWIETGNIEVGNRLKTAIKVGGYDEEQYFFLIPPGKENPRWEYWVFAAWAPGETSYNSMIDYLNAVLETTNNFINHKKDSHNSK